MPSLYAILDVKSGATVEWRATRDEAEAFVDRAQCERKDGADERATPPLQVVAVCATPPRR